MDAAKRYRVDSDRLLAARFLAAFLCLHFVYPPSSRLERPSKNSGNIRLELRKVLWSFDCLSGKVPMNTDENAHQDRILMT